MIKIKTQNSFWLIYCNPNKHSLKDSKDLDTRISYELSTVSFINQFYLRYLKI